MYLIKTNQNLTDHKPLNRVIHNEPELLENIFFSPTLNNILLLLLGIIFKKVFALQSVVQCLKANKSRQTW